MYMQAYNSNWLERGLSVKESGEGQGRSSGLGEMLR